MQADSLPTELQKSPILSANKSQDKNLWLTDKNQTCSLEYTLEQRYLIYQAEVDSTVDLR